MFISSRVSVEKSKGGISAVTIHFIYCEMLRPVLDCFAKMSRSSIECYWIIEKMTRLKYLKENALNLVYFVKYKLRRISFFF